MNWDIFTQKHFPLSLTILALILILGLGAVLYFPMVNNYYFADELDPIVASQVLKRQMDNGEADLSKLFRSDFIDARDRYNTHYRPVGYLFSFLVYRIFGVEPKFLNLLIVLGHLTTVVLVFFILRRLLDNHLWAFCAALIFAVEGVTSDAIFYIGAGQLYMPEIIPHYICLIAFVYWIHNRKTVLLIISWISALLAIFANEFSWPLIPLVWAISYFYGGERTWKLPFKPRFYPYYLAFTAYIISGYKCITSRPEMMESTGWGILARIFSARHIKRVLDEIDQVFHKIPLAGDILRTLPQYILGISVIAVIVFILVYTAVKIKDKRYRFLLLWLVFTLMVLLPVPIAARYLYHSAVPFWAAALFIGWYFLERLKTAFPKWNIKIIGAILYTILLLIHISMNYQREHLWSRVGDFYLSRIYNVESALGGLAGTKKIYYLISPGVPERAYDAETFSLTQHLRVYLDDPYIQYELIHSQDFLDTLKLSANEILLSFDGSNFQPLKFKPDIR
ncbi:MAG: hypothetical protein HQ591_10630 [candidate division Zixibacteria bacterium]|nr:hypothetical protein [Candidatus Tariuqbacter arcticus]